MSRRTARVYCLGDSLTEASGFPELLRRRLADTRPDIQWEVENGGIGGMTAKGLSPEGTGLPKQFLAAAGQGVDVCLLMLGSNDAFKDKHNLPWKYFEEEDFSRQLSAVATNMQRASPFSKVLMTIPPPVSGVGECWLDDDIINHVFPKLIPALASKLGFTCIDCFSIFQTATGNEGINEDGIHLSKVGANMVASTIHPYVLDAIALGSALLPVQVVNDIQSFPPELAKDNKQPPSEATNDTQATVKKDDTFFVEATKGVDELSIEGSSESGSSEFEPVCSLVAWKMTLTS